MTRVVLHVGIGKTGTTALQSYLSYEPIQRSGDKTYEYIAIAQNGEIVSGAELKVQAEASPLKSISSLPSLASIAELENLGQKIHSYAEKTGNIPILSQEDWSRRYQEFLDGNFLKRLELEADVVFYVRPQVDWFQSGWWQWWAWLEQFDGPEQLVGQWGIGLFNWEGWMRQWERVEGVRSTSLRLHSGDVVADFAEHMNFDEIKPIEVQGVSNPSLGLLGVKLLRTFPGLRHFDDANVDIALSKLLPNDERAPWIVSPDLARNIIDTSRSCNVALSNRLPDKLRSSMLDDRRWWDPDHYAKREWARMEDLTLSVRNTRSIVEAILKNYMPWIKNP